MRLAYGARWRVAIRVVLHSMLRLFGFSMCKDLSQCCRVGFDHIIRNTAWCEHGKVDVPALGGSTVTFSSDQFFCCCVPQEEYKRGVSMWNFDVASLKAQAALVSPDVNVHIPSREQERSGWSRH
jgi:hypothetical protein